MSTSLLVDRVKIQVLSSGVGPFDLGAPAEGFRGTEVLIDGGTYSYAVESGALYEVGQGQYVAAGPQFLRTPQISSNGGAAVAFPASVQLVFTARAEDLIATGGSFPIVNALGNNPAVAIGQQAATDAIAAKASAVDLAAYVALINSAAGATNVGASGPMSVQAALDGKAAAVDLANLVNVVNTKAPIANPTFTGTVNGITKAMVELGNADNTSDANKPVSTAQQTALNAKAPLANPVFTGSLTVNGARLFAADPNDGATYLRGDAGGWAVAHYIQGSAGTVGGGFGGAGTGDVTAYLWMGPAYNSPNNFRVNPEYPSWGANPIGLTVPSRAAMKALTVVTSLTVMLTEAGREGLFKCIPGTPPTDTLEGLYVVSNTASFYWARVWDKVNGQPEWFGAVPNSSGTDNTAAILACLALCPTTNFAAADYWHQSTIYMSTSFRRAVGVKGGYKAQGDGTRLVFTGTTSKTAPQFVMGTIAQPATIDDCVFEVYANAFALVRNAASFPVTPPAAADVYAAATGLLLSYVVHSEATDIKSLDSMVGCRAIGAIKCYVERFNSQRIHAGDGSNPTHDYHIGILAGGPAAVFGLAGANASIRFYDCGSETAAGFVDPTGVLLKGYFADTFIDDYECAGFQYGMRLDGDGITATSAHQDVSIHRPILDACSVAGIRVLATNTCGSIDIVDPYVAPVGTGIGLSLDTSAAPITVVAGKLVCASGTTGFKALNSQNFDIDGIKIRDASSPVILDGCSSFDVRPNIFNQTVVATAAVTTLNSVVRGTITPIVNGQPTRFTYGVFCTGTGFGFGEVNLTGVNPGAFATVNASFKLWYNGATVAAATFGSGNVVSGAAL